MTSLRASSLRASRLLTPKGRETITDRYDLFRLRFPARTRTAALQFVPQTDAVIACNGLLSDA